MAAKRKVIGFRQDDRGDWIVELECGHSQHVRHDPPWTLRPWTLTPESRSRFLGYELTCVDCDEPALSSVYPFVI